VIEAIKKLHRNEIHEFVMAPGTVAQAKIIGKFYDDIPWQYLGNNVKTLAILDSKQ
jgi:hypothetical protein